MRRSGEWRPRLRLAPADSGGAGDPPAGHYDPAARNSLYWVERPLVARCKKSGPGSEIATVERREAGVPIVRDAPRLNSVVGRASQARQVCAFSALRSPLGEKGKRETRRPRAWVSGPAQRWLFDK